MVNLQIVGTDPDLSTQPVVGADMTEDYFPGIQESTVNPGYTRVNPDGLSSLLLRPMQRLIPWFLADGTQFTITPHRQRLIWGNGIRPSYSKVLMDGTTGVFQ